MDKIKPEYNINLKAVSNLGIKEEVRKKMSLAKLEKSRNKKDVVLPLKSRVLFRENSSLNKGIVMLNENNEVLNYFKSIQIASKATGIFRNRISRCARKEIRENGKVIKFKYSDVIE